MHDKTELIRLNSAQFIFFSTINLVKQRLPNLLSTQDRSRLTKINHLIESIQKREKILGLDKHDSQSKNFLLKSICFGLSDHLKILKKHKGSKSIPEQVASKIKSDLKNHLLRCFQKPRDPGSDPNLNSKQIALKRVLKELFQLSKRNDISQGEYSEKEI